MVCKLTMGLTRTLVGCYSPRFAVLCEIAPPDPGNAVRSRIPIVRSEKTVKQEYFVVVLAHSLHGRLRRVHIPHQAVYGILALALLGCFSLFGFAASYARMAWKVANYNALRGEAENLRARYRNLQKQVSQTNEQLASLEIYAKEVSIAYGIRQRLEGPPDIVAEGKLVPSFAESVQDYDFLRTANVMSVASRSTGRLQPMLVQPAGYPVAGRLMGAFGSRSDPFSGEGAFHKGVDISAPTGTPVHATATGIVVHADSTLSGYGRLVVIDHGGSYQTYYAHLSRIFVRVGQEIRRGELVGAVGSTGKVTAPHLHYEVRMGGIPRNPRQFLARAVSYGQNVQKDFPF
jgi:murein DD-endopeptidase MepM/ murein hydrolase activator NlpD